MIEQGLHAYLTGEPGVASFVGNRVFPLLIPQHTYDESTKLACLVYSKVSDSRQQTLCGTDSVLAASYQIDCYAANFLKAKQTAAAVRAAMIDFGGEWSGTTVKNVHLETEFDLMDPEPGLFRVSQSYRIWHVEEL